LFVEEGEARLLMGEEDSFHWSARRIPLYKGKRGKLILRHTTVYTDNDITKFHFYMGTDLPTLRLVGMIGSRNYVRSSFSQWKLGIM